MPSFTSEHTGGRVADGEHASLPAFKDDIFRYQRSSTAVRQQTREEYLRQISQTEIDSLANQVETPRFRVVR